MERTGGARAHDEFDGIRGKTGNRQRLHTMKSLQMTSSGRCRSGGGQPKKERGGEKGAQRNVKNNRKKGLSSLMEMKRLGPYKGWGG